MNRGAIARAAAVVAGFTIVSRILGYAREMVLAGAFGTRGELGAKADAFNTSLLIVNSVAAVLLYTLVTIVIPGFERERQERDERSAWQMLWTIATWVTIGLVALAGLIALWPNLVTAPFRLDAERSALMRELVQIMAPGLALQGISALLTAVLQSQRRFVGPAAVGVAFNLGIILALVIAGRSVQAAAWGVVAGAIAQVMFQLPQLVAVLRRSGGWAPQLAHPRLALLVGGAVPVATASVLQQINAFTDKAFAGTLPPGRIAALNYANAAGAAPRTVLLMPLLAPLFPVIARMAAERRDADTLRAFDRAAGVLALVSLPISAFLMLYPREVAQLLFGWGKCDAACVGDISSPLRYYAIATWAAFLGYLLNRTLAALDAPRDILRATALTVVVTIGLDLLLLGPMEHSGLALATTLGVIVNLVMSIGQLRRILPAFSSTRLAGQQVRVAVAAIVGTAVALGADRLLPTSDRATLQMVAPLAVKALVALAAFLIVMRLVAPDVLREGTGALRSIGRRRRKADA